MTLILVIVVVLAVVVNMSDVPLLRLPNVLDQKPQKKKREFVLLRITPSIDSVTSTPAPVETRFETLDVTAETRDDLVEPKTDNSNPKKRVLTKEQLAELEEYKKCREFLRRHINYHMNRTRVRCQALRAQTHMQDTTSGNRLI